MANYHELAIVFRWFKNCGSGSKLDPYSATLWIRIQIGSVFSNFVDPDRHSKYCSGSGTTQVKIGYITVKRCMTADKNSPYRDSTEYKFLPVPLLYSLKCLNRFYKEIFSSKTMFNPFHNWSYNPRMQIRIQNVPIFRIRIQYNVLGNAVGSTILYCFKLCDTC